MAEANITKSDLIDAVYKSTDIEKQVIQKVVDSFLLETRSVLEKGSTI
jgi:integration host factor subunit beta